MVGVRAGSAGAGAGAAEGGGDSAGEGMCGGGDSDPSSPDICMERKYFVAACLSCSLSSAVCRLHHHHNIRHHTNIL